MNVHIISIAYGLPDDLQAMWDAIDSTHDVRWHLFLHSKIKPVVRVCDDLAKRANVRYYPYGFNRGLSKSTNEGMLAAFDMGADVVVNIADDMLPSPGDFDLLIDYAMAHRHLPGVTALAHHQRNDTYGPCELSFTAWNPCAIEAVGMQDENLFPAYFEDNDYIRRIRLAGYEFPYCEHTKIVHKGSENIHTYPELMQQNHCTFEANAAYYRSKWGGMPGAEVHQHPFGDKRFGVRIAPCERGTPYPGYNRTDQNIVKI